MTVSEIKVLPRSKEEQYSIDRLMGLAVFGEITAARTYNLMAQLKPDYTTLLKKFARMEGQHAAWFLKACRMNDVEPDRAFADNELGYLVSQVDEHFAAKDFDALAVVQGFIVESLAIATYEPFLSISHKYPSTHEAFKQALEEEHYHVGWIKRYFKLRFYDCEDEFVDLTGRVNIQGVDCIGGTMMNIARLLDTIGMSGADCAGRMMDNYTELLRDVGIEQKTATKNVVRLFMPLIRKYRQGESTKESAYA